MKLTEHSYTQSKYPLTEYRTCELWIKYYTTVKMH